MKVGSGIQVLREETLKTGVFSQKISNFCFDCQMEIKKIKRWSQDLDIHPTDIQLKILRDGCKLSCQHRIMIIICLKRWPGHQCSAGSTHSPGKDVFRPLLGCVGGLHCPGPQHVVDGLHDLRHLLQVNHAIAVNIVHPEMLRGCYIRIRISEPAYELAVM